MLVSKKLLQIGDIFYYWTILDIPEKQVATSLIIVKCKCGKISKVQKYKLTGKHSNGCKSCMCKLAKNKEAKAPIGFKHYKKHIFVSAKGEVFSTKSGKLLIPGFGGSSSEYLRVCLWDNKYEYIHRLVALTFIPLETGRWQVNHKDKNTLNNNVDNLEWVTPTENIRHAKGEINYKG